MLLPIVHCHGSGNDFPLIDTRGLDVPAAQWPAIARALADRAGPVGGDGLLLLDAADGDDDCDFAMRMFNTDGSEAELCLNGLRCVARLAFERLGIAQGTAALIASRAAVACAPDLAPGVRAISETAGPVSLDIARWPLHPGTAAERWIDAPLPPLASPRAFTAVAMPNPHLVAFVERIDDDELSAIGRRCEAAPAWLPRRANVSFVEQRGTDLFFVRTFERGVGLTDSCGSATAASAYAACLTGRAAWAAALTMRARGGTARAEAHRDRVTLIGNATWEWAGTIGWDATTGLGPLQVERRYEEEVAAWARLIDEAR